jgi:hypothetical protein
MDLCRSAEVFVGDDVHGFAAQVLLVSGRRVVAHGRVTVPGAEALELLGTDLVDVDLAEIGIIDRLHRRVQVDTNE